MITGRFEETSGRPFIEARLILPRLNIQGDVLLLVDTGADSSVIMPSDALRLGVPYDFLQGDHASGGIGGTVHSFVERAILVFADPNVMLYAYDLEIDVMPNDREMEGIPSLLGRDVLDRWRMTYDPQGVGLRVKARSADMKIDLAKG